MAKLTSYIVSWVLLLTACLSLSAGVPVHSSRRPVNICTSVSLDLLDHIKTFLDDVDLFTFNCSERQVEVTTRTHTASVCAPFLAQDSRCLTPTNIPTYFNKSKCLGNIATDLAHYVNVLESYLNIDPIKRMNPEKEEARLTPVIEKIKELRDSQHCSLGNITVDTIQENYTQMWKKRSFNNRIRLCEVTQGFYIRAITINRAMGYISSGDHHRKKEKHRPN